MPYSPLPRSEYIARCRYYRGEETCPEGVNGLLWEYEQRWVDDHFSEQGIRYLRDLVAEYKAHHLGSFRSDDGTPLALKALLFNRFVHWNSPDPAGFKEWYLHDYFKN